MASAGNIKTVKLGTDEYELLAKYLQDTSGNAKTWKDIEDLANIGLKIVIDEPHATLKRPKTDASANTLNKLYLVHFDDTTSGTYTEFITIRSGSEGSYTYAWEQIGTTDVDLSNYVTKGDYVSDSQGAHEHTVTGTTAVPTISKTDKKMAATASGTAVGVKATAAAITALGTPTTDKVLGEASTFTVSGDTAKTNIAATATGTAVAGDGSANAITALGTATTADAITGFGAHTTADAITGFGAHTTDKALGVDTTFAVSGDVTKTNVKATAAGTAVSTENADFVQSYPGVTSKMVISTVTGINGSVGVPSSVSKTDGTAASWSASVDGNGALSFSWTANTPTVVTVGDDVTVAKPAAEASSFVTGLSASGTGDAVLTGLGTAVTAKALTSAAISTQPTITLATGAEAGEGVIEVATAKGTLGVSVGTNDQVDAITALGTPTTAAAITALGTATTAKAITGFGAHTTAACLTGVKVTAQPTIALATGATAGAGVVEVATGKGTIAVSASGDMVDAITGFGAHTTADVATEIEVTAQPTITLDGDAATGIDYVKAVTIGSEDVALASGTAASAGAHTHTTTL